MLSTWNYDYHLFSELTIFLDKKFRGNKRFLRLSRKWIWWGRSRRTSKMIILEMPPPPPYYFFHARFEYLKLMLYYYHHILVKILETLLFFIDCFSWWFFPAFRKSKNQTMLYTSLFWLPFIPSLPTWKTKYSKNIFLLLCFFFVVSIFFYFFYRFSLL